MTDLDRFRMTEAKYLSLRAANGTRTLEQRREDLNDAIRAMQSLDDLGSPEENAAAAAEMDRLIEQYRKLNPE